MSKLETLIEAHDPVIITKIEEYLHYQYVAGKLAEAEAEAGKPGARWTDYKTVLNRLKEKYA